MTPDDFDQLVRARRSVRGYLPTSVDPAVIDGALSTTTLNHLPMRPFLGLRADF